MPSSKEEFLQATGWRRCFVACEPRLSEAVETYQELGYEVTLLPVPFDDTSCTECMRVEPHRYRLIYVRPTDAVKTEEDPAALVPTRSKREDSDGE